MQTQTEITWPTPSAPPIETSVDKQTLINTLSISESDTSLNDYDFITLARLHVFETDNITSPQLTQLLLQTNANGDTLFAHLIKQIAQTPKENTKILHNRETLLNSLFMLFNELDSADKAQILTTTNTSAKDLISLAIDSKHALSINHILTMIRQQSIENKRMIFKKHRYLNDITRINPQILSDWIDCVQEFDPTETALQSSLPGKALLRTIRSPEFVTSFLEKMTQFSLHTKQQLILNGQSKILLTQAIVYKQDELVKQLINILKACDDQQRLSILHANKDILKTAHAHNSPHTKALFTLISDLSFEHQSLLSRDSSLTQSTHINPRDLGLFQFTKNPEHKQRFNTLKTIIKQVGEWTPDESIDVLYALESAWKASSGSDSLSTHNPATAKLTEISTHPEHFNHLSSQPTIIQALELQLSATDPHLDWNTTTTRLKHASHQTIELQAHILNRKNSAGQPLVESILIHNAPEDTRRTMIHMIKTLSEPEQVRLLSPVKINHPEHWKTLIHTYPEAKDTLTKHDENQKKQIETVTHSNQNPCQSNDLRLLLIELSNKQSLEEKRAHLEAFITQKKQNPLSLAIEEHNVAVLNTVLDLIQAIGMTEENKIQLVQDAWVKFINKQKNINNGRKDLLYKPLMNFLLENHPQGAPLRLNDIHYERLTDISTLHVVAGCILNNNGKYNLVHARSSLSYSKKGFNTAILDSHLSQLINSMSTEERFVASTRHARLVHSNLIKIKALYHTLGLSSDQRQSLQLLWNETTSNSKHYIAVRLNNNLIAPFPDNQLEDVISLNTNNLFGLTNLIQLTSETTDSTKQQQQRSDIQTIAKKDDLWHEAFDYATHDPHTLQPLLGLLMALPTDISLERIRTFKGNWIDYPNEINYFLNQITQNEPTPSIDLVIHLLSLLPLKDSHAYLLNHPQLQQHIQTHVTADWYDRHPETQKLLINWARLFSSSLRTHMINTIHNTSDVDIESHTFETPFNWEAMEIDDIHVLVESYSNPQVTNEARFAFFNSQALLSSLKRITRAHLIDAPTQAEALIQLIRLIFLLPNNIKTSLLSDSSLQNALADALLNTSDTTIKQILEPLTSMTAITDFLSLFQSVNTPSIDTLRKELIEKHLYSQIKTWNEFQSPEFNSLLQQLNGNHELSEEDRKLTLFKLVLLSPASDINSDIFIINWINNPVWWKQMTGDTGMKRINVLLPLLPQLYASLSPNYIAEHAAVLTQYPEQIRYFLNHVTTINDHTLPIIIDLLFLLPLHQQQHCLTNNPTLKDRVHAFLTTDWYQQQPSPSKLVNALLLDHTPFTINDETNAQLQSDEGIRALSTHIQAVRHNNTPEQTNRLVCLLLLLPHDKAMEILGRLPTPTTVPITKAYDLETPTLDATHTMLTLLYALDENTRDRLLLEKNNDGTSVWSRIKQDCVVRGLTEVSRLITILKELPEAHRLDLLCEPIPPEQTSLGEILFQQTADPTVLSWKPNFEENKEHIQQLALLRQLSHSPEAQDLNTHLLIKSLKSGLFDAPNTMSKQQCQTILLSDKTLLIDLLKQKSPLCKPLMALIRKLDKASQLSILTYEDDNKQTALFFVDKDTGPALFDMIKTLETAKELFTHKDKVQHTIISRSLHDHTPSKTEFLLENIPPEYLFDCLNMTHDMTHCVFDYLSPILKAIQKAHLDQDKLTHLFSQENYKKMLRQRHLLFNQFQYKDNIKRLLGELSRMTAETAKTVFHELNLISSVVYHGDADDIDALLKTLGMFEINTQAGLFNQHESLKGTGWQWTEIIAPKLKTLNPMSTIRYSLLKIASQSQALRQKTKRSSNDTDDLTVLLRVYNDLTQFITTLNTTSDTLTRNTHLNRMLQSLMSLQVSNETTQVTLHTIQQALSDELSLSVYTEQNIFYWQELQKRLEFYQQGTFWTEVFSAQFSLNARPPIHLQGEIAAEGFIKTFTGFKDNPDIMTGLSHVFQTLDATNQSQLLHKAQTQLSPDFFKEFQSALKQEQAFKTDVSFNQFEDEWNALKQEPIAADTSPDSTPKQDPSPSADDINTTLKELNTQTEQWIQPLTQCTHAILNNTKQLQQTAVGWNALTIAAVHNPKLLKQLLLYLSHHDEHTLIELLSQTKLTDGNAFMVAAKYNPESFYLLFDGIQTLNMATQLTLLEPILNHFSSLPVAIKRYLAHHNGMTAIEGAYVTARQTEQIQAKQAFEQAITTVPPTVDLTGRDITNSTTAALLLNKLIQTNNYTQHKHLFEQWMRTCSEKTVFSILSIYCSEYPGKLPVIDHIEDIVPLINMLTPAHKAEILKQLIIKSNDLSYIVPNTAKTTLNLMTTLSVEEQTDLFTLSRQHHLNAKKLFKRYPLFSPFIQRDVHLIELATKVCEFRQKARQTNGDKQAQYEAAAQHANELHQTLISIAKDYDTNPSNAIQQSVKWNRAIEEAERHFSRIDNKLMKMKSILIKLFYSMKRILNLDSVTTNKNLLAELKKQAPFITNKHPQANSPKPFNAPTGSTLLSAVESNSNTWQSPVDQIQLQTQLSEKNTNGFTAFELIIQQKPSLLLEPALSAIHRVENTTVRNSILKNIPPNQFDDLLKTTSSLTASRHLYLMKLEQSINQAKIHQTLASEPATTILSQLHQVLLTELKRHEDTPVKNTAHTQEHTVKWDNAIDKARKALTKTSKQVSWLPWIFQSKQAQKVTEYKVLLEQMKKNDTPASTYNHKR
jgi:hypothetical protein